MYLHLCLSILTEAEKLLLRHHRRPNAQGTSLTSLHSRFQATSHSKTKSIGHWTEQCRKFLGSRPYSLHYLFKRKSICMAKDIGGLLYYDSN